MAYNSLKRVFGETRLELKLLLLFGVGLLVIIATAFWRYGYNTAKLVYEQNRDTAQLVLQERLRTTHIGAVKIHLIRPGSIAPTPRAGQRRTAMDRGPEQAVQHPSPGKGRLDLVARAPQRQRPRR